MIRLPPTSISLSENDVSFHLQQIDIYHGLLKQGFKKKDILRYFEEHNAAQKQACSPPSELGPPSLTGVQLAARGPRKFEPPFEQPQQEPKSPEVQESSANPSSPAEDTKSQGDSQEISDISASTTPSLPPTTQSQRHAPRQSSLLRFAQVVSSSSSDRTEHAESHVILPARTYRPRTDTYSYNQSEISESELINGVSELHLSASNSTAASHNVVFQSNWAEAQVFVPGYQRPLTSSAGLRRTSRQPVETGEASISRCDSHELNLIEPMTPRLVSLDETLRHASMHHQGTNEPDIPSSPPAITRTASTDTTPSDMSPSPRLPSMSRNRTPVYGAARDACTEPRRPRHQYLDGSAFLVYNDAFPARGQPQTPADLSRHPLLTQQDASYTAPPGVLHTGSPARRIRRDVPEAGLDQGEQTPMAQAMGSRERRARELMRGVRAEELRLRRLRQQDRETIARGLDGNSEFRDGPGPAIETDSWRDELEGDRVGDENWNNEDWTPRGNGMRVTSGNARDVW